MNCTEFEDRLQHLFEHGAEPGPERESGSSGAELLEHAAECESCRGQWEQSRMLAEAIVAWRGRVPAVDLAESVASAYLREKVAGGVNVSNRDFSLPADAEWRADPDRGARPLNAHPAPHAAWKSANRDGLARSRRALLAALTGLAALLALTVASPRLPEPGRTAPASSRNRVLANAPRHRTPAPKTATPRASAPEVALSEVPQSEVEVKKLVRNAGSACFALAQDAAGAVGDVASLVVPRSQSSADLNVNGLEMNLGGNWVDGVEYRIKPLGESLGNAFQFLWEAADAKDNSAT